MKPTEKKERDSRYPVILGQADLSEGCDHPYFLKKALRAQEILKESGLPKEWNQTFTLIDLQKK
jgi:hypothetical protein